MKLKAYFKISKLNDREFAESLRKRGHKVDRSTITKIRLGIRRPSWKLCEAIHKETDGAVTAPDWMDK